MSRSNTYFKSVIETARETQVTELESAFKISKLSQPGSKVEAMARDKDGAVLRGGVLNLPTRLDILMPMSGTWTARDVALTQPAHFEPVSYTIDRSLEVTLFPFSWNDLQISFETGDDPKRLLRLRMWYLEWFQSRVLGNGAPSKGVVHAIHGPERVDDLWNLRIDMGSAPAEALIELFSVMASRGVSSITVGTELDRVNY